MSCQEMRLPTIMRHGDGELMVSPMLLALACLKCTYLRDRLPRNSWIETRSVLRSRVGFIVLHKTSIFLSSTWCLNCSRASSAVYNEFQRSQSHGAFAHTQVKYEAFFGRNMNDSRWQWNVFLGEKVPTYFTVSAYCSVQQPEQYNSSLFSGL